VNYGPRSYFHHIAITCLLYSHCLLYLYFLLFSIRYTHNLCFKQTGEIDNLIVSWEQSICLCVFRFRVAASKQSLDEAPYINCPKPSQSSKHHLQSSLSLLSKINIPWFLTEGKLAAILIIPSSWGSQRAGHSPRTRTSDLPHHLGVSTRRRPKERWREARRPAHHRVVRVPLATPPPGVGPWPPSDAASLPI
jgi:hypothetical protein